jgi:hypothetical protein
MYYFIKINLGLVLSVLFYKLVSLGLWFFPYLLYGSSLIIPASAFLHFITVNCAATSLDGSQCITTTSVYVLTFMFVLLIFLILLYLNNRYLNNGVKSSKIVLFLTAAMFLFNIGGVVELGQSLIQVYENRLGSFDQNLN